MRVKGQVTVFLSLIIMCVFTLICGLVESARTAGARWYMQMAVSSSLDSVFSQYHRPLWDSYQLLYAEYEDKEELAEDFEAYLTPYLETENWYPMALETVGVTELYTVTDDNGAYLEQEILDYMEYGVWNLDFDAGSAGDLWKGIREAGAVKAVAEDYRGHAREALRLEKALETINSSLQKQEQLKREGMSELQAYDGAGFRRKAEQLIRELRRMPGLVETYRKQADALAQSLEKSRSEFHGRQEEMGGPARNLLEEEIRQYESYVKQDGERRQEIENLTEISRELILMTEETMEQAREVERIIEEWDDDDDDDDGPDLASLWSPVIRQFGRLTVLSLSFRHGVKDKEKEGWLSQVIQMCGTGLLRFVIPEGAAVSGGRVDMTEAPSDTAVWSAGARTASLPDHLMVNEYCGEFFRCFLTDARLSPGEDHGAGQETDAAGGIHTSGRSNPAGGTDIRGGTNTGGQQEGAAYEMEYLIVGKDLDEENLGGTVARLLAVREGLNLIHILSDSQKRSEARNLAVLITGAAGMTPLVLLTAFFVMSVWALGEAVMDIRGLMEGKKVPVLKAREDWALNLDGLLSMGSHGDVQSGGGDRGLGYLSWLKILLLMEDIVMQEYRMMDIIQMNIRKEQDSFRMRRGVYQVKLTSRICGKHVFFSLGFVDKTGGGQPHTYWNDVEAERVY